MLIIGAFLQFIAQAFRFWISAFGLFSVTFFVVALRQAMQDTQADTFVTSVKYAHRWLGVIHGCYALGGLVGPIVAAALASNFEGYWGMFYTVPLGIGCLNVVLCVYAFRDETPVYARLKQRDVYNPQTTGEIKRSAFAARELGATVRERGVWVLSIFFFIYLGTAITAGGWVVEYLHVVRDGPLSQVGYMNAAFMMSPRMHTTMQQSHFHFTLEISTNPHLKLRAAWHSAASSSQNPPTGSARSACCSSTPSSA